MSERRGGFRGALSRSVRGWRLPALLIVAMLAAMGYWLTPRLAHDVTSTDGQHQWQASDAPLQRSVVWQPAVPLEARPRNIQPGDSLIRPRLADDATTLYFTLRNAAGGADIYRAEKTAKGWQPAAPLQALNTDADEIGPELVADGSRLFFYSDRSGGEGGFDIYVSDRTNDGWGPPRNLGPAVNTPADDIDPAISPDGSRLYLASNRTLQMQAWIADAESDEASKNDIKPWTATLRAQNGLRHFDLYVACLNENSDGWINSLPLTALNRSNSSEGAPHIDSTGTWLLFASDREGGQGDAINFDIYRARLRGGTAQEAENLGPGVNTLANETEPALSPEGFLLVFSSDREEDLTAGGEPSYRLYSSTAIEVEETIAWDDENWQSFLAFLVSNWWLLLLVALVIALVAAIVWYVRAGSFRRAPVPAFLMAAMLLHVVGGLGSFYVFVPGAREFVDERFIVLKEIVLDDEQEAEDLEKLEEMPELKPVEPVETGDIPKQIVETTSVARAKPLAALPIQARLTLETPPEESVFPKAVLPVEYQPNLDRLALALPSESQEKIEKEQLETVESTERKPPSEQKVRVELTEQQPQPNLLPRPPTPQKISDTLPRAIVTLDVKELLDVEPVTEPVSPQQTVEDVELAPRNVAQLSPIEERVTVDPVQGDAVPLDPPAKQRQSPRGVSLQLDGDFKAAPLTPPTARSSPTQSVSVRLGPLPTEFKNATAAPPIVTSSVDDLADSIPTRRANVELPQESVQVKTLEAGPNGPSTAKKIAASPKVVSVLIESQPGPSSPSTVAPRGANSPPTVADVGRPRLDATKGPVINVSAPPSSTAKATPVKRSGLPSPDAIGDEPIETIALDPAVPSGKPTQAQPRKRLGVEVDIQRGEVAAAISAAALNRLGKSGKSRAPRLVSGQLAREQFESTLSPNDPSVHLARSTLSAADLQIADESIGLQRIFRSRRGEAKRKLLLSTGGNDQSELAVQRGLTWLEKHQAKDGRWTLHRFGQECKRHGGGQCNGHGSTQSDAAATGFALLPFSGSANTHRAGDYRPTVDRGLKWLVGVQKPNGDLYTGGNANGHMYSHAIATIALCEAYGMTGDPSLRGPAQKAIDFIVVSQHKPSGGWRYGPNQQGDTSVVGWQVMALKSGQMATPPLKVPPGTLAGATKWLDSVEGQGNLRGQFGYQNRGPKIAMTAEGLLCRKYLGSSREDASLRAGADHLLKHLPKQNSDTSYYWYYATQFMYHMKGDYWKRWNAATRDLLVRTQQKKGHLTDTWNPRDNWENSGGRLFSTSLRLLMLEVYYRHDSRLPLYRTLE